MGQILNKWGKIARGRITANGENKMGQTGKNGAKVKNPNPPRMSQNARIGVRILAFCDRNCHRIRGCPILKKMGQVWRKCHRMGESYAECENQQINKQVPHRGFQQGSPKLCIPTNASYVHSEAGSRIANSAISQEILPKCPKS